MEDDADYIEANPFEAPPGRLCWDGNGEATVPVPDDPDRSPDAWTIMEQQKFILDVLNRKTPTNIDDLKAAWGAGKLTRAGVSSREPDFKETMLACACRTSGRLDIIKWFHFHGGGADTGGAKNWRGSTPLCNACAPVKILQRTFLD